MNGARRVPTAPHLQTTLALHKGIERSRPAMAAGVINKWFVLVASAMIQAFGSPYYTFSVYAPALKTVLDLSQTQLEFVGAALHVGCCIAQAAGAVYQLLSGHPNIGPRAVLLIGCVLSFSGYYGMWAVATSLLPPSLPFLIFFAAVAGNSASWYDCATIVTCVRNFPAARGMVMGILKAFVGVGGSLYACFYVTMLSPDSTAFIWWTSIMTGGACLVLGMFVNHVPGLEAADVKPTWWGGASTSRFASLYGVVAVLSLQQGATALLQGLGTGVSDTTNKVLLGTMCGLILLLFVAVADSGSIFSRYTDEFEAEEDDNASYPSWLVKRGSLDGGSVIRVQSGTGPSSEKLLPVSDAQHEHLATIASANGLSEPLLSDDTNDRDQLPTQDSDGPKGSSKQATASNGASGSADGPVVVPHGVPHGPANLTLGQCMGTLNFWLLFMEFTFATGSAVTFQNNLAQIFAAAGGSATASAVLVSLYCVSNSMARIFMGYVPEHLMHSRGTPRTAFLLASTVAMALMSACTAFAGPNLLFLSAVLAGLALGSHWTLVPAILSDLFGVKHFAGTYTFFQLAPAIGGLGAGTFLAGWLYDRAAQAHDTGNVCIGLGTFLILTGLGALGVVAAARIAYTTAPMYKLYKTKA